MTLSDEKHEHEATLPSGVRVHVSVEGPDGERLAREALDGATERLLAMGAAKPSAPPPATFAGIVGQAPAMRDLFRMLERLRATSATVLISGENGTGKELVAKAIHGESTRGSKRFVATNCSAFNDNLLESELFGHKRGSFTGAVGDKPGLFEVADGGTFFMDEVGDMSPALQVKLLRVLQEGVFLPVGGTEPKKVDVRIIAATNRELTQMVQRGTFREDLFYRLHVVALRVPALRERMEDLPLLVAHFLDRLSARDGKRKVLAQDTLARLRDHLWPGNVRELENELERVWVLSGDAAVIGDEHLSPQIRGARAVTTTLRPRGDSVPPAAASDGTLPADLSLPDAVEALERKMIAEGLRRAKGNKSRAAEILRVSRRNLIRKVQAYKLEG